MSYKIDAVSMELVPGKMSPVSRIVTRQDIFIEHKIFDGQNIFRIKTATSSINISPSNTITQFKLSY
jgi:hypothetical protein